MKAANGGLSKLSAGYDIYNLVMMFYWSQKNKSKQRPGYKMEALRMTFIQFINKNECKLLC